MALVLIISEIRSFALREMLPSITMAKADMIIAGDESVIQIFEDSFGGK